MACCISPHLHLTYEYEYGYYRGGRSRHLGPVDYRYSYSTALEGRSSRARSSSSWFISPASWLHRAGAVSHQEGLHPGWLHPPGDRGTGTSTSTSTSLTLPPYEYVLKLLFQNLVSRTVRYPYSTALIAHFEFLLVIMGRRRR